MKRIIFAVLALLPGLVLAAGGGFPLDKAEYDLSDKASLQRGAATFMNYCAGCHSTQYQRYNRVAADIGIPTLRGLGIPPSASAALAADGITNSRQVLPNPRAVTEALLMEILEEAFER